MGDQYVYNTTDRFETIISQHMFPSRNAYITQPQRPNHIASKICLRISTYGRPSHNVDSFDRTGSEHFQISGFKLEDSFSFYALCKPWEFSPTRRFSPKLSRRASSKPMDPTARLLLRRAQ